MMWLFSIPLMAAPKAVYHAEMTIQVHGPTFAGRLHGELLLSESDFRVSVLGPSGSEIMVFVGNKDDISGALLAEGIQFSSTKASDLATTLSHGKMDEIYLHSIFLGLWPCQSETVTCREKTKQARKVSLGAESLVLHYPNYKKMDGRDLPSKIRADLPPIDWKLRFNIKKWTEVPYQKTDFVSDFPEPELERELVPLLEDMITNAKKQKGGHPE